MQLKIRSRLILGTLIMAVILMSSSALIVAVIVGKQTREGINTNLYKTIDIIKEELLTKKHAVIDECKRLVSSSDMGSEIKFLHDFPGKEAISTTRSTFVSNTERLFQSASANRFSSMATYDTDGNLITFIMAQQNGKYFAGFHILEKTGSMFAGGELARDEKLSDEKLLDNAQQPDIAFKIDIPATYLSSEKAIFTVNNKTLSIKVMIPLTGNLFNPETQQVEPAPMGILIAYCDISSEFSKKMKKITGLDINIYLNGKYVDGTLKSYNSYEIKEPFQNGNDIAAQNVYIDEFRLLDKKYFHALLPIFNEQILTGTIAAIQSGSLISINIKHILIQLGIVNITCIFIIMPFIYFFSLQLSNPLKEVVNRLKDIAEGEGDLTMRFAQRGNDEIGELAHWFNVFIEKLQGIIRQIASNSDCLNQSSQNMATLSEQMSENSSDMVNHLNATTVSVQGVNQSFISVALAMKESHSNLDMIMTASENMAVNINHVADKTKNTSDISNDAVQKVGGISNRIKELDNAAQEIGKVTDIINKISDQTNLLALNATIEAARAGEAGKGFTVVAGEIKELAKQTALATDNIKEQIEGIQRSTERTGKDLENIVFVINTVNEEIVSITSDIIEHSKATQEVNENVIKASQGISEVDQNITQNSDMMAQISETISNLDLLANNISNRSTNITNGTKALFNLSEELYGLVRKFKYIDQKIV